jgi:hypothetical protein
VGDLAISYPCAVARELVATEDECAGVVGGGDDDDDDDDGDGVASCFNDVPPVARRDDHTTIAWHLGASHTEQPKPLVSRGMQLESSCGEVLVFVTGAPVT